MNHMVMGCVAPFVFRVFSWFLENLEIIPLLALGYTPGTMSHLPCDIIEGNGHIMSTMSRYPRVLCGFLRVLRSGGFIRPKLDSWQGVGLLCLCKGALLRLSSSLPVMPERESLGMPHESAPTCAFSDDIKIQASWGPLCSIYGYDLTQVPHLDSWGTLDFHFLSA